MRPMDVSRVRGVRLLQWVMLLALCAAPVSAQDFRGAIIGRVNDSSGARLPGVTVTATNAATNVGSTTTTNGEGSYTILFLTPGTYTVTAELAGFKKLVRDARRSAHRRPADARLRRSTSAGSKRRCRSRRSRRC